MHYPPVRDPIFPRGHEEAEVARYLARREKSLRSQVVVIGSHVHNYERFRKNEVTYLVSGGGGAKPVPAFRMSGELSRLRTSTNFHYLRFTLDSDRLRGVMVRFDPARRAPRRGRSRIVSRLTRSGNPQGFTPAPSSAARFRKQSRDDGARP